MKHLVRVLLLAAAAAMFFESGLICYSQENECPSLPPAEQVGKDRFLSAHGLTQETFSIWLKEHSVWRQTYTEDLKQFTYIPKDFDTDRGEE